MSIVVLDACVLYPATLRDIFMWLAVNMVYQPRWTADIHSEWMRNVLKDHSEITPSRLDRTRALMDEISVESVVTGYARHIPNVNLPDPDDRHVLAAAIESGASAIITFNLTDFPTSILEPLGIRAVAPDDFLISLFEEATDLFLMSVRNHRASLKAPPKTAEEYHGSLRANRLPNLANRLEEYVDSV